MPNKRLAIYVQRAPDGVVRDYVFRMLNGLRDAGADILVVNNGPITDESRAGLAQAGIGVIVCDQPGHDLEMWRMAVMHYGYDNLSQYDSVLFTNNTFYGPIYPLGQMWDEMDSRDCDFWGINRWARTSDVPSHILADWIAFKSSVIKSDAFHKLFDNPKACCGDTKALSEYGAQITGFFEQHGFTSDTYMDFEKYNGLIGELNPQCCTDMQVMQDKNPVIKREYFFHPAYKTYMIQTLSDYRPRMLMEWMRDNTEYDPDMIWQDLLAYQNMSDIMDVMQVMRILPDKTIIHPDAEHPRTAFIAHIYYAAMIEYMIGYLKNLPEYVDVYVVNTTTDVADACRDAFSKKLPNRIFYRIQENRGREQAAMLITCRDIFDNYDIVGIAHSKMSPQQKMRLIAQEFRNRCMMCLLYSREYVENLIDLLNTESRLGIVAPLMMMHGPFRCIGNQYDGNANNIRHAMADMFGMNEINLPPYLVCAMGGMFWAKTAAFKTLLSHDWQYSDFPQEPLTKTNGLFPHALERMFGILAQHDGYYTTYAGPIWLAESYASDLHMFKRNVRSAICSEFRDFHDHELINDFNLCVRKSCAPDGYKISLAAFLKYNLYRAIGTVTRGRTRDKYREKQHKYKHKIIMPK